MKIEAARAAHGDATLVWGAVRWASSADSDDDSASGSESESESASSNDELPDSDESDSDDALDRVSAADSARELLDNDVRSRRRKAAASTAFAKFGYKPASTAGKRMRASSGRTVSRSSTLAAQAVHWEVRRCALCDARADGRAPM